MRCPNCGTEIVSDSHFCMECGFKLGERNIASEVPPPPPKIENNPPAPVNQSTVYCPTCGVENIASDKFCKMCGGKIHLKPNIKCTVCGSEMPKHDRFCPNCGSPNKEGRMQTPPAGMPPVQEPAITPPPVSSPQLRPDQFMRQPSGETKQVPDNKTPDKAGGNFAKTIFQVQKNSNSTHGRTLKILKGERSGEKFPFTQSINIGRNQGEIVFANDEYLDSRHLYIDISRKGVTVKDLETVNGVYYHLVGEFEAMHGSMFFLGDFLFQIEELSANEWSLNGVWERGVKLMGSLKNQSPWCRLRFFSPLGTTAGIYLLWNDTEIIGSNFLPTAAGSLAPRCKISRRNKKIIITPFEGDVYIRLNKERDFALPIRLRCGLETMEITSF